MAEPIGRRTEVELRAPRDEAEPEAPHTRAKLGTGSSKVDQACITGLMVRG